MLPIGKVVCQRERKSCPFLMPSPFSLSDLLRELTFSSVLCFLFTPPAPPFVLRCCSRATRARKNISTAEDPLDWELYVLARELFVARLEAYGLWQPNYEAIREAMKNKPASIM